VSPVLVEAKPMNLGIHPDQVRIETLARKLDRWRVEGARQHQNCNIPAPREAVRVWERDVRASNFYDLFSAGERSQDLRPARWTEAAHAMSSGKHQARRDDYPAALGRKRSSAREGPAAHRNDAR